MKKSVLAALLVACSVGAASAQSDSTTILRKIEIQIEQNTLSFDANKEMSQGDLASMIGFATTQVTKLQANNEMIMDGIAQQEKAGTISEEQADMLREKAEDSLENNMDLFEDMMENWGESYGEKMEVWAEQYEENMEEWSEALEANMGDSASFGKAPLMPPMPPMPPMPGMRQDSGKKKIIISKEGVIIRDELNEAEIEIEEENDFEFNTEDFFDLGRSSKSKKIDRTEDYLDLAFGFNQQLEEGQFLIEDGAGALDFWKSTSFNIGSGYKTRIGSPYSKLYIKYGIDFSWHNFRLSGSDILMTDADSSFFGTVGVAGDNVYEKNKYHIAYFNIPVMFQLDFSEPGDRDEAFTVGVGGYGGGRLLAKRELEYKTATFRKVEEKAYDDFFTNQFRYGLMAQVGYESFKVTMSYDLNDFFRGNDGPQEYNMVNVTLGFTL
jgi:hypothetical protein